MGHMSHRNREENFLSTAPIRDDLSPNLFWVDLPSMKAKILFNKRMAVSVYRLVVSNKNSHSAKPGIPFPIPACSDSALWEMFF